MKPTKYQSHNIFQSNNRNINLWHNRPTSTERLRIKQLLKDLQQQLQDIEIQLKPNPTNCQQEQNSSQQAELYAAFEAFQYWYRSLLELYQNYSLKIPIETEFAPQIKLLQQKSAPLKQKINKLTPV